MNNAYSTTWFATFMDSIREQQTLHETTFVMQYVPLPTYQRVLDVCCGTGRHAAILSDHDYNVTGIDINDHALARATAQVPKAHFLHHDMRDLATLNESFDAVLCLWQSFGYFSAETNAHILQSIADLLPDGGRCILDIYHRQWFERFLGVREFTHQGRSIVETKTMHNNRLLVDLRYDDGTADVFEWQVFTPEEIIQLAQTCGFECIVACTGFDAIQAASAEYPRMQLVFEKRV